MNINIKLLLAFGAGVVVTLLVMTMSESDQIEVGEEVVMGDVVVDEFTKQATEEMEVVVTETAPTPAPTKPVVVQPVTPATPQYVTLYPYSAMVSYTGSRFLPEEAVIIKGGVVTFRNDSNKKMWIAANLHPNHDAYPEVSDQDCAGSTFDQCTSVGPGGTWTFAFNKLGKWFYHEENRPVATARVRVITTRDYDTEF